MDQAIQVINPKDKNVSPEERHKSRISELPPVPKGNNRDIRVSVQELVYGSKTARVGASPKSLNRHHELISSSEEVHGDRKTRGTSGGLDSHVFQRTSSTDKSLVENPKHDIRGPEEEDYQEREDSNGQCVQYDKNSDGVQKQGRGKIEQIFSEEVDLIKLVNQTETCNQEIITKLKTFEYITQELGNEILQVKESQKTIIGLENINKDNILSLAQICARIGSNVTLLNQPDDNSISFITRQLKESRIKVQNLENSTGHNASLFQEQLEKSDKARLEWKEDIQSNINSISLINDLQRWSTLNLDRNVLDLNNDLHHTVSSNSEVENACNFKDIPRLEEWPTFSGEGEYNHMEFMKEIDMFKEEFNIPDEYISSRLHSLITK
ncbi:hypothetical protein O181_111956 [Austropuccinia psidii MF-1]|uniref:Uncharacterized protein n=1 Tax=Austropuccinia psidii MF-1 TaxID=1389203 RepID=A0A9Q3PT49_9BASI|nr:hypothetical protein [Austropuccinia psidii MF-1]